MERLHFFKTVNDNVDEASGTSRPPSDHISEEI